MTKRKITRVPWYRKEPEGTQEEIEQDFNLTSEFLYKIISYADKEEIIPKEIIDRERRLFTLMTQGPKAGYYRLSPRPKLTSADVLYILIDTHPSDLLGAQFGVSGKTIREIRRGDSPNWKWEYAFVKRLRNVIKNRVLQTDVSSGMTGYNKRKLFKISKVHSPGNVEILHYLTAKRKAVNLRNGIVPKGEMAKLLKDGTLDIIYPIEEIEVLW